MRKPASMQQAIKGEVSHRSGQAAEEIVALNYDRRGRTVVHRRWRGAHGEIDLIARDGAQGIFIEVKASASHARAAERLHRRQMDRLCLAAAEFVAGEPGGQLTEMRFDLALVDGRGGVQIIENAFGEA